MDKPYLAAVDIGGTKITVSIADISRILVKVYQPVHLEGDNLAVPAQVDFLVGHACEQIGIERDEITALGVSTCGPFGIRDGELVLVAPNLCGGLANERGIIPNDWTEIPLQRELSRIYNNIHIENDGISAVTAERMFGAGKGEDNVIYITWSTGIGSGAYIDGRLIRGKNGNAPHIGHIYLVDDGPRCGCGNFGDMEALASGVAIARDYKSRVTAVDMTSEGVTAESVTTEGMTAEGVMAEGVTAEGVTAEGVMAEGVTAENVTAEDVFNLFRKGDPKAESVITNAARYFARGLVSINAILDTRVFIIGGSVFMNNRHILLPLVKEEFYKSFPALSKDVEFRPSALDSYLGDLAALCLVMPDDWVRQWQQKRPWEFAPEPIVLGTNSALK
ncbi:MAG: ROK family protein [ANME-2 cluster archaeon]|nr:ROK family protein [ANME-2 cluster archaeon]MBC2700813.1 ROK family protein [ANME-2 cluster archaeon]MBC2747906.1 ROK family protein [ANME-2 cluster archaeon]